MTEAATTRGDPRGRQLLSYLLSVALHLSLVLVIGPCAPRDPRVLRVERPSREALDRSVDPGARDGAEPVVERPVGSDLVDDAVADAIVATGTPSRDRDPAASSPPAADTAPAPKAPADAAPPRRAPHERRPPPTEPVPPETTPPPNPPRPLQPRARPAPPDRPPAPKAPEPPAPEPKPTDQVRVVHTEGPGDRPELADAESRFDQSAEDQRRSPILSDREGPTSPNSPGSAALKADPTAPVEVAAGASTPAEAADVPAPAPERDASAAPDAPLDPTGARVASDPPATSAGAAPVLATDPTPPLTASSPRDLPDGSLPIDRRPTDWWDPIAVFVPPAPHSPESEPASEQTPTDALDPTTLEREATPAEQASAPAKDEPVDAIEAPPEAVAPAASRVVQGAQVLDATEARSVEDAVTDAIVDEAAAADRAPTLDTDARAASSHQTVIDAQLAEAPRVAAVATPRGAWIQAIDEVVRARWNAQGVPVHLVGLGVRGDATVRFQVAPNGRTSGVSLVRRSGNVELDALAVAAIPDRVPKAPAELGDVAVEHEITFRYR